MIFLFFLIVLYTDKIFSDTRLTPVVKYLAMFGKYLPKYLAKFGNQMKSRDISVNDDNSVILSCRKKGVLFSVFSHL